MDANALSDRLFRAATGTLELYAIYLGERLGLYRALASGEALTSGELAARARVDERYVREWLEHQAATELVEVDDARADARTRRYRLPAEHVPVLVDEDDLRYSIPVSIDLVRLSRRSRRWWTPTGGSPRPSSRRGGPCGPANAPGSDVARGCSRRSGQGTDVGSTRGGPDAG